MKTFAILFTTVSLLLSFNVAIQGGEGEQPKEEQSDQGGRKRLREESSMNSPNKQPRTTDDSLNQMTSSANSTNLSRTVRLQALDQRDQNYTIHNIPHEVLAGILYSVPGYQYFLVSKWFYGIYQEKKFLNDFNLDFKSDEFRTLYDESIPPFEPQTLVIFKDRWIELACLGRNISREIGGLKILPWNHNFSAEDASSESEDSAEDENPSENNVLVDLRGLRVGVGGIEGLLKPEISRFCYLENRLEGLLNSLPPTSTKPSFFHSFFKLVKAWPSINQNDLSDFQTNYYESIVALNQDQEITSENVFYLVAGFFMGEDNFNLELLEKRLGQEVENRILKGQENSFWLARQFVSAIKDKLKAEEIENDIRHQSEDFYWNHPDIITQVNRVIDLDPGISYANITEHLSFQPCSPQYYQKLIDIEKRLGADRADDFHQDVIATYRKAGYIFKATQYKLHLHYKKFKANFYPARAGRFPHVKGNASDDLRKAYKQLQKLESQAAGAVKVMLERREVDALILHTISLYALYDQRDENVMDEDHETSDEESENPPVDISWTSLKQQQEQLDPYVAENEAFAIEDHLIAVDVYSRVTEVANARKHMETAIQKRPLNLKVNRHAISFYARQGDFARAVMHAETVLTLKGEKATDEDYQRAINYYRCSQSTNLPRLAELQEKLIELKRSVVKPEAHEFAGKIYEQMGNAGNLYNQWMNKRKALDHYQKAIEKILNPRVMTEQEVNEFMEKMGPHFQ